MKECTNCKTMLEDDALFCHECGTKQEVVAEKQSPAGKKCVHCGEELEDGMDFCPFCGKKQTQEEVVKPHKAKEQEQFVHQDSVNEEKKEEESIPLTAEELQNAKTKKYIGIGLFVIVVILPFLVRGGKIGGGWYVLMAIGAILSICFTGEPKTKNDKDGIDFAVIILAVIAAIMFIWGPINPKYY